MTDDEINVAIAERVMGWQVVRPMPGEMDVDERFTRYPALMASPHVQLVFENEADEGTVWAPATDIADAWRVVEQMRADDVLMQVTANSTGYIAHAVGARRTEEGFGTADTAPRAICLAALRAKGVAV